FARPILDSTKKSETARILTTVSVVIPCQITVNGNGIRICAWGGHECFIIVQVPNPPIFCCSDYAESSGTETAISTDFYESNAVLASTSQSCKIDYSKTGRNVSTDVSNRYSSYGTISSCTSCT